MSLKTLHGEHFDARIKRWWSPSSRRAAKNMLAIAEANHETISIGIKEGLGHFLNGEPLPNVTHTFNENFLSRRG